MKRRSTASKSSKARTATKLPSDLIETTLEETRTTKIVNYLKNTVVIDADFFAYPRNIHALSKGVFDFLRNLMIAGLILFLGLQAESLLLVTVAFGAMLLMSLSIASSFGPIDVRPFHPMRNKLLGAMLGFAFRTALTVLVTYGVSTVVAKVVIQISNSYAAQQKMQAAKFENPASYTCKQVSKACVSNIQKRPLIGH